MGCRSLGLSVFWPFGARSLHSTLRSTRLARRLKSPAELNYLPLRTARPLGCSGHRLIFPSFAPWLPPLKEAWNGLLSFLPLRNSCPHPLQVWQGGDGDTGIPTSLVVGGDYTVVYQFVQSTLRPLGSPNHLKNVVVPISCQTLSFGPSLASVVTAAETGIVKPMW